MGKDQERTVILVKGKRNQRQASKRATNKNKKHKWGQNSCATNWTNKHNSIVSSGPKAGTWKTGIIVNPQPEMDMAWGTEEQRCRRTEDTSDSLKVTNYVHVDKSDARKNVTHLETGKISGGWRPPWNRRVSSANGRTEKTGNCVQRAKFPNLWFQRWQCHQPQE